MFGPFGGGSQIPARPDEANLSATVREVFVGGSLFTVGGAAEAAVFDYNLSSIVTFATPVDNGLITGTAPNPDIDHGSITNPLTEGIDDLGTIIYSQTVQGTTCLLYTSPSPRDSNLSRMPSSA